MNTQTYKFFIDFAARYGIEYIILDEGWYKTGNLLQVAPGLDMPALLAYARAKNVGVILWAVWKTLADQFEPALAQFQAWGIKGMKVDFMQRDDQPVIDFYHRVARELAKRKMLVDFHGGQRPALMTRTWPNIISTEGVKGLEHLKWSNASDPEHNVTLPFTRMFLGPMDYTPGAMLNATRAQFKVVFKQPMSLGTRCHQLAMYVVYESPLQMLADSPTNYLREPETMEFLSRRSDRLGRDARPRRAHRRLRRGRAPQGPGLVRRRDDRLDAARAGRRPVVSRRGAGRRLDHGRVRGRRGRRRGAPASYVRSSRPVTPDDAPQDQARAGRRLGRAHQRRADRARRRPRAAAPARP